MTNWIKEHGVFSGIAGGILAAIVAIIIALMPNIYKEEKQGVSIGGNVFVSGDSAITGNGDIIITKEVFSTSDRMMSIQKRLRNLDSQDPVINSLIKKAKDAFYSNNLDDAKKIIKKIDLKQGKNQ